mmetsp:Transcript_820/g.2398  ORF Transcript_820/g.2398 Transcript_820/m.2398 type:complete len:367 (+) Transcript_820:381-1481(+)
MEATRPRCAAHRNEPPAVGAPAGLERGRGTTTSAAPRTAAAARRRESTISCRHRRRAGRSGPCPRSRSKRRRARSWRLPRQPSSRGGTTTTLRAAPTTAARTTTGLARRRHRRVRWSGQPRRAAPRATLDSDTGRSVTTRPARTPPPPMGCRGSRDSTPPRPSTARRTRWTRSSRATRGSAAAPTRRGTRPTTTMTGAGTRTRCPPRPQPLLAGRQRRGCRSGGGGVEHKQRRPRVGRGPRPTAVRSRGVRTRRRWSRHYHTPPIRTRERPSWPPPLCPRHGMPTPRARVSRAQPRGRGRRSFERGPRPTIKCWRSCCCRRGGPTQLRQPPPRHRRTARRSRWGSPRLSSVGPTGTPPQWTPGHSR